MLYAPGYSTQSLGRTKKKAETGGWDIVCKENRISLLLFHLSGSDIDAMQNKLSKQRG